MQERTPGRKIIQISCGSCGSNGVETLVLYALCDDGSAWVLPPESEIPQWQKLPPIPVGKD